MGARGPVAGVRTMNGRTAISFGGGGAGPDGQALTTPGVHVISTKDRHVRIVLVAGDNVDELAIADAIFPFELGDELGRSIRRAADRAKAGAVGMQSVGIPLWGAPAPEKDGASCSAPSPVSPTASTLPPAEAPPWVWLLPDHRGEWSAPTVVLEEKQARELAAAAGVELAGPFIAAGLVPTAAPLPIAIAPAPWDVQEPAPPFKPGDFVIYEDEELGGRLWVVRWVRHVPDLAADGESDVPSFAVVVDLYEGAGKPSIERGMIDVIEWAEAFRLATDEEKRAQGVDAG